MICVFKLVFPYELRAISVRFASCAITEITRNSYAPTELGRNSYRFYDATRTEIERKGLMKYRTAYSFNVTSVELHIGKACLKDLE